VLITTAIVVGWLHIALGIATALARGTAAGDFFEEFRNGNYSQLDQEYAGFVRIRGLFPESSAYADFGFAYMVLNTELWYRSIRPRATGMVAIGLALILFFSTSSTAYVGLAGYAAFVVIRAVLFPAAVEPAKLRRLAVCGFSVVVVIAIVVAVLPAVGTSIFDMLTDMTVGKSDTSSAQQRLFWAMQGWQAVNISHGLGIGPGSFRSSSMVMAMLGSTGVIGIMLFAAYALTVFQPTRASTMGRGKDLAQTIGGAMATAAMLSLVPSAVSSPKADPGPNFAFLAGASLALRPGSKRGRETLGANGGWSRDEGYLVTPQGPAGGGYIKLR
jgi:hypothetical protein